MFIAMNRFRVAKGSEASFEQVWMSRDSHLDKVPGFVEFHLLKGPEAEDHTLYASHTVWENRAVFEAWTKSDAFRAAHSRAATSRCIRITRSSRVSRFGRQLDAARLREAYSRTACENPVNVRYQGVVRKTFTSGDFFSCRSFGNGLRFRRGSGSGLCANAHGAPFWMVDFERICPSHQIA